MSESESVGKNSNGESVWAKPEAVTTNILVRIKKFSGTGLNTVNLPPGNYNVRVTEVSQDRHSILLNLEVLNEQDESRTQPAT